jgi:putative exosortase-associated protein (TIGR04073 family)
MNGRSVCAAGLGVLLLAIGAGPARAADPAPAGSADRIEQVLVRYNLHPAFEKLGRGAANLFAGWMEVPLGVHHRYSASDTAGSVLTGLAIGCFRGLVRTAVGAYETVTFFLPYPEHYAPILPTLEYFRRDSRRERLPLE